MDPLDSKFTVNLNDQFYHFKATLYNGVQKIEIPQGFIELITIKESLLSWVTSGSLLLKNDLEFFERGDIDNTKSYQGNIYTFRSDGRNRLNIRFFPIANINLEENIDTKFAEDWEINYDFAVVSIQDVSSTNGIEKFKQLEFVDERFQIFEESSILWSTRYLATRVIANQSGTNSTNPALLINAKEGKCLIGASVKDFIQTVCNSPEIQDEESIFTEQKELMIGFSEEGSIEEPDISVAAFSKEWDEGSDTNYIFYTTPATYNVNDNLSYLLSNYIASDSYVRDGTEKYEMNFLPGILRLHRYKKEWSLVGIDKIFEKASPNNNLQEGCVETLTLQSITNTEDYPSVNITYDIGQSYVNGKLVNIHIPNTSIIYNYNIAPMSGVDDMSITNRPVVQYDIASSTWSIYCKQNSIEAVHTAVKEKIIKNNLYNGSRHEPLLSTNKAKLNGVNTKIQHTVHQTVAAQYASRNDMIMRSVFLNQAITFSAKGLTVRTPGKFINIISNVDRLNDFEKKFNGQWLLTEVTHTINKDNGYTNNCIAVRVSSYTKLKTTDSLTPSTSKV
jgi:hypothetical protein